MKIGILHLSDVHYSSTTNIDQKIKALAAAVRAECFDISKAFVVITGDIANSGKQDEYGEFRIKFDEFIKQSSIPVETIIVPGNHDCNFKLGNQLRNNTINFVDYSIVGDDSSVIDNCLIVQKEFWDFYGEYQRIPAEKIFYYLDFVIEGKIIRFNCFNSAWMSSLEEKPGKIFLPVKKFAFDATDIDVSVSLMHHPLNWFSPETDENNKREVEKFLTNISTLQLFGHEHQTSFVGQHDFDFNLDTLQFCGDIFHNDKKPKESGFQFIKLDLTQKVGILIKYTFKSEIFTRIKENEFEFGRVDKKEFSFSKTFKTYLEKIGIPISENGKNVKLADIYVYPHLDRISIDQRYIDSYIDSSLIVTSNDTFYWILAGASQVGKTSLLKILCQEFYHKGLYPIFIKGKDIVDNRIENLIKKQFRKNYEEKDNNFEHFRQMDRTRKILLIDDFQECKLDTAIKQEILSIFTSLFGRVVITVEDAGNVLTKAGNDFEGFSLFSIKQLGHKKTNDLIVKYHSHFLNPINMERQEFLSLTRRKFDQVCTVIGNKVVPSYPIFLISILQSLDNSSLDLSKTSCGYCYQTLIHGALTLHAKLQNDEIDMYLNFLKKYSYFLYKSNVEAIKEDEFILFYNDYKKVYHFSEYSIAKAKLLASKILVEEDTKLRFGYKYILFFLAAQHISDILNTEDGKRDLNFLFENLHIDKYANILVFITHHTNDISFMHDSLFHAMVPFENFTPISLDRDDPFYSQILDVSKLFINNLIDQKRDPEVERERRLLARDQRERTLEREGEDNNLPEKVKKSIAPYAQAFASIDIIGQIVKNRKGSLIKENIIELIKESYFTGFRTVSSIGNLFKDIMTIIESETEKKLKSSDSRDVAADKINSFIQILSLHACLSIFTKLVYAVGLKDFEEVYEEVARIINTPAAKIVTLSINSYHNPISVSKVKELVKEVKDNPVAMFIIRECIKSYIYQNYVDYSTKQRLAQLLDMKLSPIKSIMPKHLSSKFIHSHR